MYLQLVCRADVNLLCIRQGAVCCMAGNNPGGCQKRKRKLHFDSWVRSTLLPTSKALFASLSSLFIYLVWKCPPLFHCIIKASLCFPSAVFERSVVEHSSVETWGFLPQFHETSSCWSHANWNGSVFISLSIKPLCSLTSPVQWFKRGGRGKQIIWLLIPVFLFGCQYIKNTSP